MKRILLMALLLASCSRPAHIVADEKIIATSPCTDSIFLYTPGIVEGFDGRFVVSVDYGGPGTYKIGRAHV